MLDKDPAAGGAIESSTEDDEREKPSVRLLRVAAGLALIAVLAFIVFRLDQAGVLDIASWWASLGPWWVNDGWPWTSNWLSSPGFGGLAAVVAAGVALAGARHQARLNAWWQRVEWALGLYVKADAADHERIAGAAAIEQLQSSRLARSDEKAFLGEVMKAVTLDPLGDGLDRDDWSAEETENQDEVAESKSAQARPEGARCRHPRRPWRILRSRRAGEAGKGQDRDGGVA